MYAPLREQVINVLTRAKELVKRGWTQGTAMSDDGKQVCAAQAINMAYYGIRNESLSSGEFKVCMDASEGIANATLIAAAVEVTGMTWHGIPNWNDFPGRTQTEVVDTFDRAIKMIE